VELKKIFLLIFLFFSFSQAAFCGRPLSTDDAGTVEKRHWEIEFGISGLKEVERGEEEEYTKEVIRQTGFELVVTYGLRDNWDMGFSIPYIFIDCPEEKNIDGFQDILIQTKYRLLEEKNLFPAYALGIALKTKSANEDKGLGSDQLELEVNNIFSKEIKPLTLHLNLGYHFLTRRKGQNDIFFYGLAMEYPFSEKLCLVSEITGETEFKKDFGANSMSILAGFHYALSQWFTYDAGCSLGVSDSAPEYEFSTDSPYFSKKGGKMHIPDGFLSTPTWVSTWVISLGALSVCLKKLRQLLTDKLVPLMGVMAAFIFAAQMLNFPVAGGTSGHLLGGVLAAVLLGPYAASIVISSVLIVQCLLFQDGGLSALGANIFNMAFVGVFGGYLIYRSIYLFFGKRMIPSAFLAAWFSVVLAASVCAVELAISGTSTLNIALPAMAGIHILIGLGEAIITSLVLGFILKTRPDLIYNYNKE